MNYLIAISITTVLSLLCILFYILYTRALDRSDIAQQRAEHYKLVSEYIERINRVVNSMDGEEARYIQETIPDAVKQTVFSGLEGQKISLYKMLADGGVNPMSFRRDVDVERKNKIKMDH